MRFKRNSYLIIWERCNNNNNNDYKNYCFWKETNVVLESIADLAKFILTIIWITFVKIVGWKCLLTKTRKSLLSEICNLCHTNGNLMHWDAERSDGIWKMPDNCLVVAFFCIDFHHGCLTACKGGYYGYAIFGNCHRAILRDQFNSSKGIKNKGRG